MAQQIKRLPKNLSWIPVKVEGGKTTSQSCPLTSVLSPWLHMHQTHIKKDGWGRRNVKKNIATTLSPWSFSELLYHSHGIGGLNQKLPRIPCSPGWIPSACGCGPGSSVSAVIPPPHLSVWSIPWHPALGFSLPFWTISPCHEESDREMVLFTIWYDVSWTSSGIGCLHSNQPGTEKALRHQYASLNVEMCLFPWERRGASTSEQSVCQRVGSVNPRMCFMLKTLWTQE